MTNQGLMCHRVLHSDERPFKCDICDKTFKLSQTLRLHHKNIHRTRTPIEKNKRVKCEDCGKDFSNVSVLNQHAKKHSSEFKCSICDLQCQNNRVLNTHMKIHFATDPYRCKVCMKEFLNVKYLEVHLMRENSKCSTTTINNE